MVKAFNLVSISNGKSIELKSGSQTWSELNLFELPLLKGVGFKGTSI